MGMGAGIKLQKVGRVGKEQKKQRGFTGLYKNYCASDTKDDFC
jgi:hypothetical protein